MGLDQYWYIKNKNAKKQDTLFFQHRKIPALEKYMSDKWKGNETFNCRKLYINRELLSELKESCLNKELDHNAEGFFLGFTFKWTLWGNTRSNWKSWTVIKSEKIYLLLFLVVRIRFSLQMTKSKNISIVFFEIVI